MSTFDQGPSHIPWTICKSNSSFQTTVNLYSMRMKTAKFTNLSGSGSFQKHKLTGLFCNKSNGQSTVIVFEMQSELHSSVTKDQLTEEYDLL